MFLKNNQCRIKRKNFPFLGVSGKKSIEGIEGDREAPGVGSRAAGEEAGGADAQVHAGAGTSAGACPGPPCAALRRVPGCRQHA